MHSSEAQRLGYPTGPYWKAFGLAFVGAVVIALAITVAFYVEAANLLTQAIATRTLNR